MISILLATHNGARFFTEQLASISRQSRQDWRLFIRDDGSTDATPDLIAAAAAHDRRIVILERQPVAVGAAASYLALLEAAGEADYYAFCDQDDLWEPDKLARACAALAELDGEPALYCSRQRLVDEGARPLGLSRLPSRGPSFANALVQNIVTGCSTVFNRQACALLCSRRPDPERIIMHDWWCYLVVSAFGTVRYDPRPGLAYRQHRTNAVGELQGLPYWRKRLLRVRSSWRRYPLPRQLEEFRRLWGDALTPVPHRQLLILLELMGEARLSRRLRLLRQLDVYRQDAFDTLLCYLMLLIKGYR